MTRRRLRQTDQGASIPMNVKHGHGVTGGETLPRMRVLLQRQQSWSKVVHHDSPCDFGTVLISRITAQRQSSAHNDADNKTVQVLPPLPYTVTCPPLGRDCKSFHVLCAWITAIPRVQQPPAQPGFWSVSGQSSSDF